MDTEQGCRGEEKRSGKKEVSRVVLNVNRIENLRGKEEGRVTNTTVSGTEKQVIIMGHGSDLNSV